MQIHSAEYWASKSAIYKDGNDFQNDFQMSPLGWYSDKDEELIISAPAVLLTQETVSLIQAVSVGFLPSTCMDLVRSGNIDPNTDPIHMNPPAGRVGGDWNTAEDSW